MDSILHGVDLHSSGSQPWEDLLISEPNVQLFKINRHSRLSCDPISHVSNNGFIITIEGNGGNVVLSSGPNILISDLSSTSRVIRLEQPWVFNEIFEISVSLRIRLGCVEESENNGSWGIVVSGIFLDDFSHVMSWSMFSWFFAHFMHSVFSHFFRRFLIFLDELNQIILFSGGSS